MKEQELSQSLMITEEKLEALSGERDELRKSSEETRRLLSEREEDLSRARDRMDVAVTDLEARLASEIKHRYVSFPKDILCDTILTRSIVSC